MAESPLWPKEKVDVIEVDEGAPLSLQCNPPPGLPSPVIFWMSSCELGKPSSHLEPCGQPFRRLQRLFKITTFRVVAASSGLGTWLGSGVCFSPLRNHPREDLTCSECLFSPAAMEPIHQDKRVSQGQNGDLYFSNVMLQDAQTDYSCNARFHFTHTIQQKNPYTLKVKTSKCHDDCSGWVFPGLSWAGFSFQTPCFCP